MSIYAQPTSPMTRPTTPESSLTNSLYNATHTMEELTAALAEFSSHRAPSPDLQTCLTCCCGREECENLCEWLAIKGKLESRLRLSAEVGQALLQKHEAYVRRHEVPFTRQGSIAKSIDSRITDEGPLTSQEERDTYVSELIKEKVLLEKRLNQALVNHEVSEVSTKSILQELEHARATISRLTASQARSTGWDVRLSAAIKEKEDMQQERDIESQRARLAESRFAALKEKTARLQVEVRKLQESLESKRIRHLESSESTLQDARARIQLMQNSQAPRRLPGDEHDDLMRLMELLVNDNETLKRDNAELQNLLADCREDMHALQEEVEEQRINSTRTLRHKRSIAESLSGKDKDFSIIVNPNTSLDRDQDLHSFEPLTPETTRRPLSPTTHISISTPSEVIHWTSQPEAGTCPHPQLIYELDSDTFDEEPAEKSRPTDDVPILIRSRGVQAFEAGALRASSFALRQPGQFSGGLHLLHPSNYAGAALTSSDPRSESSSFSSETLTSHISLLLDRFHHLFTKLSQSDALTLTNRLKRQHLYHGPGDVKHLSRSSANQIVSEIASLRAQFRMLLEDEKTAVLCTRKELRVLFRLMREMFGEMGRMRVLLNDVILDPAEAGQISEAAMDPNKSTTAGGKNGWDWMAPLSKLFPPGFRGEKGVDEIGGITKSSSGRSGISGSGISGISGLSGNANSGVPIRPRTITVPKIAPALGASTTTVNVEFSGAGAKGRTVTNTFASNNDLVAGSLVQGSSAIGHAADRREADWQTQTQISSGSGPGASGTASGGSKAVMDIFVGAPSRSGNVNVLGDAEPWVVLPRDPRKAKSMMFRERGENDMTSPITGQSTQAAPVPGSESSDIGVGNLGGTIRGAHPPEDDSGGIITGFSRYVDAVIDPVFRSASGAGYIQPPSLPRSSLSPVRIEGKGGKGIEDPVEQQPGQPLVGPRLRRGLSDSSIHSTFTSHLERDANPSSPLCTVGPATTLPSPTPLTMSSGVGAPVSGASAGVVPNRQPRFSAASNLWLDRQTVLQVLSRTVQNFRLGHASGHSGTNNSAEPGAGSSSTNASGHPTPAASTTGSNAILAANNAKVDNKPYKKRGKPRPSAPASSTGGRKYYSSVNTVSGAMGAAALLNSLPAPPSMRDPFVWEA